MRWFVVLCVFALHACVLGQSFIFGQFVPPLEAHFQPPRPTTDIVLIGTMQYGLLVASGGALALRPTKNRIVPDWAILAVAGGMWVLGTLLAPRLASSYETFAGIYIPLTGIGAGILYWSTLSYVPSWFPPKGGVDDLAIAQCFVSLAPGVFGLVMSNALPIQSNWVDSMTVVGGVGAGAIIMAVLFARPKPPPPKQPSKPPKVNDEFWPMFLYLSAVGFFMMAFLTPYTIVPSFVLDKGHAAQDAAVVMLLMHGGSLAGRVAAAVAAAITLKYIPLTALAMIGTAVALFAWLAAEQIPGISAFTFFYGFFSGACFMLFPTTAIRAFSYVKDPPRRIFLLSIFMTPGAFTAPIVAEALRQGTSYTDPIVYAACMVSGAAACLLLCLLAIAMDVGSCAFTL